MYIHLPTSTCFTEKLFNRLGILLGNANAISMIPFIAVVTATEMKNNQFPIINFDLT